LTKGKFREKGRERSNIIVRKFPVFSGFFFPGMKGMTTEALGWHEFVA
jgi:hypothetical protein